MAQDEEEFDGFRYNSDSVMPHVQQEEDEDEDEIDAERVRKQAAQMEVIFDYRSKARARAAEAVKRDEFRLSVRAKARATSGSKRPRDLSPRNQQQEVEGEEDLLLCDVVDEYSAALSTTIYVTNLPFQVTEEILRGFFAQAGPIVDVYLPRDHRAAKHHRGCAFVELPSLYYVYKAMDLDLSTLFGNRIRLTRILRVKEKSLDVGANLFIGNLDADMDENKLYDIFRELEVTVKHIKMMKDPDTGTYLGSGFLNFDSYEASNSAIEAIEESFNANYRQLRPVMVFYASMKDIEGLRHDEAPYPSRQMPVPPEFSTMQHPLPQWQQQPQGMPPQQFWPSPLNTPQMMNWPAGIMSSQHVGWAPPLPQQLAGGHHSMMPMSMPPPLPPPPPPPPPPPGT